MLEHYKKKYRITNLQYILIDNLGNILESDDMLFSLEIPYRIQNIHPFFEIIDNLITIKNECFEFSCINLNLDIAIIDLGIQDMIY